MPKLSELYIELSARGLSATLTAINDTRARTESLRKEIESSTARWQVFIQAHRDLRAAQAQLQWKLMVADMGLVGAWATVIGQKFYGVQQNLQQLGGIGAGVWAAGSRGILQLVQAGNPVVFEQFTLTMRDLSAVIGFSFAPVLQTVTGYLRTAADAILNLDEGTKETIVHWVAMGTAAGGFLMIVPRITGAIGTLISVLRVLSSLPIVATITLVAGAFSLLSQSSREAGGGVGGIMAVIQRVTEAARPIVEALGRLFTALAPIFERVGNMIGGVIERLIPLLETIINTMTWVVEKITWLINRLSSSLPAMDRIAMVRDEAVRFARDRMAEMGIGRPAARPSSSSVGFGGREASITSLEAAWQQLQVAAIRDTRTAERTADATELTASTVINIMGLLVPALRPTGSGAAAAIPIRFGLSAIAD